jgi:hypothetical protein
VCTRPRVEDHGKLNLDMYFSLIYFCLNANSSHVAYTHGVKCKGGLIHHEQNIKSKIKRVESVPNKTNSCVILFAAMYIQEEGGNIKTFPLCV